MGNPKVKQSEQVDLRDIYDHLAEKYHWTVEYISTMPPSQRSKILQGPKHIVLNSIEEVQRFQAARQAAMRKM